MPKNHVADIYILFLILFIFVFFCGGCTGIIIGKKIEHKYMELDAIKNNVAKYIVDENGNVEFVWLNLLPS